MCKIVWLNEFKIISIEVSWVYNSNLKNPQAVYF